MSTLRAMVVGMWKDCRNDANKGVLNPQFSNWRDFRCTYAHGFSWCGSYSFPAATVGALDTVAMLRRRGNYWAARSWIETIRRMRALEGK